MTIDTDRIVMMSEANGKFSSIAKFSREHRGAVIYKDSRPAFVLTPIEDYFELTDDEKNRRLREADSETLQTRIQGTGEMIRFSRRYADIRHEIVTEMTP